MSKLDVVVVPFGQNIRGTVKQLGITLGRFLEKIQQEEDLFSDERAEINSPLPPPTSCLFYIKINVQASLSRAVYRCRCVPPCVKNKITAT